MDLSLHLRIAFLILASVTTSFSLRILSLDVPHTIPRGREAQLTCSYDLEGEKLYSVKWYRDDMEFFRFVPRDKPQQLYFPLEGIDVDFSKSTKQSVFIQNVQMDTGGKFRCEVSADAPFFKTAAAEKWMVVQNTSGVSRAHFHRILTVLWVAALFSLIYTNANRMWA